MTLDVAVICPDVRRSGGLRSLAEFVVTALEGQPERFTVRLVSVATSSSDEASLRLGAPSTWRPRQRQQAFELADRAWLHVGTDAPVEVEWVRYRASRALKAAVRGADLAFIIAGTPAWGILAKRLPMPSIIYVATLSRLERAAQVRSQKRGRAWREVMSLGTRYLDRQGVTAVNHAMVINRSMWGVYSRQGIAATLVYPGVPTDTFHPSSGVAAEFVLSVGRLAETRKDWPLLIRSYASLRRLDPNAPPLVLVGRGDLHPETTELIHDLNLTSYVRVHRDLDQFELAQMYRKALLMVLTSKEEGLGIVILEAMASGVPVVASDLVGTRESVVHGVTGLLVDRSGSDPVQEFADAMHQLLSDPQRRRRFGEAALAQSRAALSEPINAAIVRELALTQGRRRA